ncbi:MAG: hypothetical protein JW781_10745 [Deltaproteobacteria bacterium]|nr:hypothetical protein [Candidatus Anaeroferrophillacea bacterium]
MKAGWSFFRRLPFFIAGLAVIVLPVLPLVPAAHADAGEKATAPPLTRLATWLESISRWRHGKLANLSFSFSDRGLGVDVRFMDLGISWQPAPAADHGSTIWKARGCFRATGANGQLSGRLEAAFTPRRAAADSPWDVQIRLMLADLTGTLPGGIMIEQWRAAVTVSGRLPPVPADAARLTLAVDGGPILIGDRFLDLAGRTLTADLAVRGVEPDFELSRPRFSGRLAAVPLWAGKVAGKRQEGIWQLVLDGEPQPLRELVALLLEAAPVASPPVVSGRHTCRLEAVVATGEVCCRAGELRLELEKAAAASAELELADTELTVPLAHWSWRFADHAVSRGAETAAGRFHLGRLESPLVVAADQELRLRWAGSTVSSTDAFTLHVAGLPVTVDGLRGKFGGTTPADHQLTARVTISPAPARPLPAALLELIPETVHPALESVCRSLGGSLTLELDGSGTLAATGALEANAFGGRVMLEGPFARRLFSSSRVMGAGRLGARELDLDRVTAQVPVGRATGIINIELTDFAFAYGQPTRFDLAVASVPRHGVSQTISVEAIENLSVLSSGGAGMGGILQSGINRFFSHYRYRAVGGRCQLRGDIFRLNGTIHDGGREYIVRRGLVSGVDVVNHNPDNRISFRDMQERISRIFADREATTGSP